jgi:hypothetical protein
LRTVGCNAIRSEKRSGTTTQGREQLQTVLDLRRERQTEGIAKAKARGVYKDRKPTVPTEEVRRLRAEGKMPGEIAEALGVSRMSVWRALNA